MKFPEALKFRHCISSVTACCPCATPAHINPATNNDAAAFMAVFPPRAECVNRSPTAILRTYHSETALPTHEQAYLYGFGTCRHIAFHRCVPPHNFAPHGPGFALAPVTPSPAPATKYPSRVRTV